MKGTIADIQLTRRIIAAEGKKGKPLPVAADVQVVTSATSADGLGPGQMDGG